MNKNKQAVLVTTVHRGVFFGYTSGELDVKTIRLEGARLCIYWSADLRGFMGLATIGPNSSCKVGPPANITLQNVTSVTEVSEAAEKAWLEASWKS